MQETYTVKPGDTLYGISNQFGVSVTELAELNGIKGSNLAVGTILKIPSVSGTNPNNMFMYTVKSGDTLYKIATKYNTTPQKIIDLNYLKNSNIVPGQVLRIPETYTKEEDMYMPNYTNYIVKKGDSITNPLNIGQILKIRIPNSNEVIEECIGPDYIPLDTNQTPILTTYTVKSGDNLYSIAKKYNTSASAIMLLNNLPNTNLSINQKLKIPAVSTVTQTKPSTPNTGSSYIVKNGDNLYSIAKKFNTTVDAIKQKNNLKTNNLQIGQKLII